MIIIDCKDPLYRYLSSSYYYNNNLFTGKVNVLFKAEKYSYYVFNGKIIEKNINDKYFEKLINLKVFK